MSEPFGLYLEEKLIANAFVRVTAAYWSLLHHNNDTPDVITLELTFEKGTPVTVTLPLSELTANALVVRAPLFVCQAGQGAVLRDYIIHELLVALHTGAFQRGWFFEQNGLHQLPDGRTVYIMGNRLLGKCLEPYLIADTVSCFRANTDTFDPSAFCNLLRQSPPQVILSFGYILLSCIRSCVLHSHRPLQGVLYICGPQGLGKTTLATLLTSWFNGDNSGRSALLYEASSTAAATREAMVLFRDLPLVIDDLCLSASRSTAQKRMDLGAQLLREGANTSRIIKKLPNGKTAQLDCAAGLILTAEFDLENESDVTRSIFVPIDCHLDIPKALTSRMIGGAIIAFLEWFVCHYDSVAARLEEAPVLNMDAVSSSRAKNNYANLFQAFYIWYCSLTAMVSEEVGQSLLNKLCAGIRQSNAHQISVLHNIQMRKPKGNLAYILLGGFEQGAFNLTSKIKKLQKHDGIFWKGDLCLRRDALERYVRTQPGYQSWSLHMIVQQLRTYGALVIQESDTAQVHIGDSSLRVYRIRLDVLEINAQGEEDC